MEEEGAVGDPTPPDQDRVLAGIVLASKTSSNMVEDESRALCMPYVHQDTATVLVSFSDQEGWDMANRRRKTDPGFSDSCTKPRRCHIYHGLWLEMESEIEWRQGKVLSTISLAVMVSYWSHRG